MKKALIILSLILTGVYLTNAINLNLSSGSKLNISNWQEINNIVNKINLDSNNLNIKGKLVTNFKICSGENCLGECDTGKIWDTNTTSCVVPATTPETAGKDCADILANNPGAPSGDNYYIKPDGYTGDAFKVYCDMRDDGGRTMVFRGYGNWTTTDLNNCISNDVYTNARLVCIDEDIMTYTKVIKQRTFGTISTELVSTTQLNYRNGNWPGRGGQIRGVEPSSFTPRSDTQLRAQNQGYGCRHNGSGGLQDCLYNVWYVK